MVRTAPSALRMALQPLADSAGRAAGRGRARVAPATQSPEWLRAKAARSERATREDAGTTSPAGRRNRVRKASYGVVCPPSVALGEFPPLAVPPIAPLHVPIAPPTLPDAPPAPRQRRMGRELFLALLAFPFLTGRDGSGTVTDEITGAGFPPGTTPGTPPGTTPGGEVPGGETPGGTTPGGTTPGGTTPGGETPGGETPGGSVPGGTTPGGVTPGGETPGGATPGTTPGTGPGETFPGGSVPGGSVPGGSVPGVTPPGSGLPPTFPPGTEPPLLPPPTLPPGTGGSLPGTTPGVAGPLPPLTSAVPEPSSVALLAGGLVALLLVARKRRAR